MDKGIKFRDDEKSYKQFTQLTKEEKQQYINYLLTLDPEILGFNDTIILNQFAPNKINKVQKFLEL
jgi:hypothetical protein